MREFVCVCVCVCVRIYIYLCACVSHDLRALGTGLYLLAANVRHSCDPNCAVSFDGTSLQLHSAREIAAGVRCMLACICDSRGRHACVLAAFRA